MRLLRDKDWKIVTKSEDFQALIEDYYPEWLNAEQVAQEEMISYLKQRFVTDRVFTNTSLYDATRVYYGKNLVEYTETAWNENTSYTAGTRVLYEEKIYQCIASSQGIMPTNTSKWIYVTDNLSLYYVTLPHEEWDFEQSYAAGDVVWYNNKQYTCIVPNLDIQPGTSAAVWGTGTTYSFSAKNPDILYHAEVAYTVGNKVSYEGVLYNCIQNSTGNLPTDTNYFTALTTPPYWTKGDNRNPLIVRFLLDITRYHFERSIPARNVSDLCKEAYNGNSDKDLGGALGWLNKVAAGKINATLPIIVPQTGRSIEYGNSRPAQDNQLW